MSGPGEQADISQNTRRMMRRSGAISRMLVLLALTGAASVASLLVSAFGPGADNRSGVAREGVLLSVGDAASVEGSTFASPSESTARVTVESDNAAQETSELVVSGAQTDVATAGDEQLRRMIIGSWQQSYYGKRVLTVLPDGKAKMVIRPDSVWTFAFGEQIDLDMFWTIENGRIDYGYSGGSPKEKVELAAKTWGDRWEETILELTNSRLVLLCEDGQTRSEWARASTDKAPPAASKDRSPADAK
ncbi:hypothetical protein GC176_04125 [bacterium]|nr:hypothetical protein [bacterium]